MILKFANLHRVALDDSDGSADLLVELRRAGLAVRYLYVMLVHATLAAHLLCVVVFHVRADSLIELGNSNALACSDILGAFGRVHRRCPLWLHGLGLHVVHVLRLMLLWLHILRTILVHFLL